MNVFFDGSLRSGILRTCVWADGHVPLEKAWDEAERLTSGHAEWLAAREAARFAASRSVRRVELVGDCENVIRHMDPDRDDAAQCEVPENALLARETSDLVNELRDRGTTVVWRHAARGDNPAGVHLDRSWNPNPN